MAEDGRHGDVAVIGDGPWGAMLADLLAVRHRRVLLWGPGEEVRALIRTKRRHPLLGTLKLAAEVTPVDDVAEAATPDLLFVSLHPSKYRPVMEQLGPHLTGDQRVVSASRGLEVGSGARLTEVIRQESCVRQVGALAGPRFDAKMALKHAPGAGVVASAYPAVVEAVKGRLHSERYRVYGSTDLVGVEAGPVLSLVIVMVAGMVEGMALGAATQSIVLTRGLAEVARLAVALGARPETFRGLSSLGVMLGACLTGEHPAYKMGVKLARDPDLSATLSGDDPDYDLRHSADSVLTLARARGVSMPLTEMAAAVMAGRYSPADALHALMSRPATDEL